jgi:hypothetical protein
VVLLANQQVTLTCSSDATQSLTVMGLLFPAAKDSMARALGLQFQWGLAWDVGLSYDNNKLVWLNDKVEWTDQGGRAHHGNLKYPYATSGMLAQSRAFIDEVAP